MTRERPLRVVVADDQASVREGLALLLDMLPDIEVVATAGNGLEAVELVGRHAPDAILLDLGMPVMNGTEATRELTARFPGVAVVILTTYADETSVLETLRAGAKGYLTKDSDRQHIATTLRSAVEGLAVLDPRVQASLLGAAASAPRAPAAPEAGRARPDGLTAREAEVLALIAAGHTNQEIAEQLYLTANTVKTHISRVFAKTSSRDRAAAMRYAQRHGLG